MPLLSKRKSLMELLQPDDRKGKQQASQQSRQQSSNPSSLTPAPSSSSRPVSDHGVRQPSRLSHELLSESRPISQPQQEANAKTKRFSLLKMRNYSEPQLRYRAKQHATAEEPPPLPESRPNTSENMLPGTPSIVRTAPTGLEHANVEKDGNVDRKPKRIQFGRQLSKSGRREAQPADNTQGKPSATRWRKLQSKSTTGLADLHRHSAAMTSSSQSNAPPPYGEDDQSALAVPATRFSDSSDAGDSHRSSGDQIYGHTTTTHTVSTHTTFFKLPRRNKNRNSLFPLPVKLQPTSENRPPQSPTTPRAPNAALSTTSQQSPDAQNPPSTALNRRHTEANPPTASGSLFPMPSPSALLGRGSLSFAEPSNNMFRSDSQRSRTSNTSSPLQPPLRLNMRDRASTTSSFGRPSVETPPPLTGSGRTSTSTTGGRSSLGGFLNLARFRQGSDPHSPRHGSPARNSKSNSFAMSREALVIPEREEGDTPGKYLERLEASVSRSLIAGILSKSADAFAQNVLRSYTRRFPFFGEPIDMSLRKFLLEAELPKETQQVDRVMEAFAFRYHECNPGIFPSPDQAYVIAFSLMMLHTDAFNKNNKRKMQKQDYVKNTRGQEVAEEVLACFYDNICYTPFVHYEEEVDINGERILPFKPKRSKLKGAMQDGSKKPTGPVDPYNLLVEQKLDMLRPAIKDTITMEDPYNYLASNTKLDMKYLQRAFTHTGVLQIISARSRPAAYEAQVNDNLPSQADTQAGIVDLKVTKVGVLWRKSTKRKKTRSPWQEWGAILTGSQLYLFKNANWVKGLQNQFKMHQKPGQPRVPVVFKPPLQEFKPDNLIKTDNAVALVDRTYNRHKYAFTFVRPGNENEVLLADDENELNDWLALINYAAAFRAAGVRVRGMVGGNEEEQRSQDARHLDNAKSLPSATGPVTVKNRGLSPHLQRQVMTARRQIMAQKISESESDIDQSNKKLESMLRNARHLQILAPIAPRTREQVLMAAAQTDAMIQWTRRGIWRTKCHRDILSLDVEQDGVSTADLMGSSPPTRPDPLEATNHARGLPRLSSKSGTGRSPPQSPSSASHTNRTSTSGSDHAFRDVFRTPPESTTSPRQDQNWHLPPLQLDVASPPEHRPSVASTLLSASTPRRSSLSQASSRSSLRTPNQRNSSEVSETPSRRPNSSANNLKPITPSPSASDTELRILTNNGLNPDQVSPNISRPSNLDGTPPTTTANTTGPSPSTPETSKRKSGGARRSLQRTLRDAHSSSHHHSHHRGHRKDKDSQGTVRSTSTTNGEDGAEGTPGLERATGRFILHGKQASVVQFDGSEWPSERMRLRRERWREGGSSPKSGGGGGRMASEDSVPGSIGSGRLGSSIGRSFSGESGSTARTGGMAEVGASPRSAGSKEQAAWGYFDLPNWRARQGAEGSEGRGKRETVIRAPPTAGGRGSELPVSPTPRPTSRDSQAASSVSAVTTTTSTTTDDDNDNDDRDDEDATPLSPGSGSPKRPRGNRLTVLGPQQQQRRQQQEQTTTSPSSNPPRHQTRPSIQLNGTATSPLPSPTPSVSAATTESEDPDFVDVQTRRPETAMKISHPAGRGSGSHAATVDIGRGDGVETATDEGSESFDADEMSDEELRRLAEGGFAVENRRGSEDGSGSEEEREREREREHRRGSSGVGVWVA
ncbi:hypothetical protein MBLNU230_g4907t1 [Neophaeotheca triangularis]